MLNVVLLEPEIPQNTGNVARTCAATGTRLHLVRPLGFEITDKHLKRAGLDYWSLLDLSYHNSFDELADLAGDARFYFLSTKGAKCYTEQSYPDGSYLVFGKETAGLPAELLERNQSTTFRIPMLSGARSLNLSNAVAVVLYEALRGLNFAGLKR